MGRRTLGCLSLALVLGGAAQAQGQDREAGRAAQDTTRQDTTAQDTLPPPPPAYQYTPPAFSIHVSVGRPGGGPLQSQPVLALQRDLAGTVVDSAVLGRTVSTDGGFYGGVSGTLSLGPSWAVRIGLGIARTTLVEKYDGADGFTAAAEAIAGGTADLQALSVESALLYRIPSGRRLQPYIELGGVLSRWTAEGELPGIAALESGITRFEAMAGIGGVVPLNDFLSARLEASTRLLHTPIDPMAAGQDLGASSSLALSTREPTGRRWADSARELLSLLRLELGLSLDLGQAAQPPPAPAETPETTTPPGR